MRGSGWFKRRRDKRVYDAMNYGLDWAARSRANLAASVRSQARYAEVRA